MTEPVSQFSKLTEKQQKFALFLHYNTEVPLIEIESALLEQDTLSINAWKVLAESSKATTVGSNRVSLSLSGSSHAFKSSKPPLRGTGGSLSPISPYRKKLGVTADLS